MIDNDEMICRDAGFTLFAKFLFWSAGLRSNFMPYLSKKKSLLEYLLMTVHRSNKSDYYGMFFFLLSTKRNVDTH